MIERINNYFSSSHFLRDGTKIIPKNDLLIEYVINWDPSKHTLIKRLKLNLLIINELLSSLNALFIEFLFHPYSKTSSLGILNSFIFIIFYFLKYFCFVYSDYLIIHIYED